MVRRPLVAAVVLADLRVDLAAVEPRQLVSRLVAVLPVVVLLDGGQLRA